MLLRRYSVMLFVFLGITLPLSAIWAEGHFLTELTGATAVLTKALIAIPLLAMATYCGRISAQHRKTGQHLRMLTAQVDSVRAYVDGLPTEIRNEILLVLGRHTYSEPGVVSGSEGSVGIPPEQIMPTIDKLLEAVKQTR